jgi:outer membrane protein OmpA-like peptidoglycan-associated protein
MENARPEEEKSLIRWKDPQMLRAIDGLKGVMIYAQQTEAKQEASKLSQCDFPNDKKPWRVDNTCKAILDDVAKNLQQNADNKLVIVGNADPSERRKNLAAERAVNSKAYLTGGEAKQGIDPSRIEVRTSSEGGKTAEYWTVPPGATFSEEASTQPVNESKVKAVPDHPKPAAKKKAAKPAQ